MAALAGAGQHRGEEAADGAQHRQRQRVLTQRQQRGHRAQRRQQCEGQHRRQQPVQAQRGKERQVQHAHARTLQRQPVAAPPLAQPPAHERQRHRARGHAGQAQLDGDERMLRGVAQQEGHAQEQDQHGQPHDGVAAGEPGFQGAAQRAGDAHGALVRFGQDRGGGGRRRDLKRGRGEGDFGRHHRCGGNGFGDGVFGQRRCDGRRRGVDERRRLGLHRLRRLRLDGCRCGGLGTGCLQRRAQLPHLRLQPALAAQQPHPEGRQQPDGEGRSEAFGHHRADHHRQQQRQPGFHGTALPLLLQPGAGPRPAGGRGFRSLPSAPGTAPASTLPRPAPRAAPPPRPTRR